MAKQIAILFGVVVTLSALVIIQEQQNNHIRQKRREVRCKAQLQLIFASLKEYALLNAGHYPDLISQLNSLSDPPDPALFVCPSGSDIAATSLSSLGPGTNSYRYKGKGMTVHDREGVLMAECAGNHENGTGFLLYGDGRIVLENSLKLFGK